MKRPKLHRDENGSYVNMRRKDIDIETLTQKTFDNLLDRCMGAVEKISKNGWVKVRTYGVMDNEHIALAIAKKVPR